MRYSLISYPDVLTRRSNVHPRAQGPLEGKGGKRAGAAARSEDVPTCDLRNIQLNTRKLPRPTGPGSENYHGQPRKPENWSEKEEVNGGRNSGGTRTCSFSRLPGELCPTVLIRLGRGNDEQNGYRLESLWYMQAELGSAGY